MADHALLVYLPYTDTDLGPLFAIEDALMAAIEECGAGELDGNDVGGGEATLFMYGPDADRLFEAVEATLRQLLPPGSRAVKRYGAPGAPQNVISLP